MRNVTIFIFITIFSLAWAGTAQAQTCDTSWGTPVDGNWTDATKWTAGVPSATTVACIEVDGDYEVSVSGTNKAKALVLGLASGTGTPTLTFSSGTLTLFEASVVRSTGQLNWSGGTLDGTLTNEGLLRLTSSSSKTLGAGSTLTNDGTIEHELGNFVFQPDAKVVNNATFDSQGDADLWVDLDGSRRFENNGLFKKSVGAGESIVSTTAFGTAFLEFDNNGTVEAEEGEIRFNGGDNTHSDGVFEAAAGAEVNFASGTHTIVGTITGSPTGTVRISGIGATIQDDGVGATINFGGTGLDCQRGTLAGTLTNAGLLRLTSGSSTLGAGSTLTNDGTIEHELGDFVFQPDAKVVNNATFDSQGDADLWVQFDGNRRFENNGLFKKSVGAGESIVSRTFGAAFLDFDNNGTVRIEEGEVGGTGLFLHGTDALIEGVGTFNRPTSNFTHAGDTGPGLSPGVLNWTGMFNPEATATFVVDIAGSGGAGATNGHDQLVVSSSAALNGQIQVNLLDGFVPAQGQQFEVLTASSRSGAFTNPNTNDQIYAGNGVAFTVIYESDRVLLVADLLEADIALEKTVSPSSVVEEEEFEFLITLTNNGPEDATDIVVLDEIPTGLDCTVDAGSGSYDASESEWTVSTLDDGSETTLTLTCTADEAGEYTNMASIQGSNPTDPNPDNDQAQATVTVSEPACLDPKFTQDDSTVPDGFITLTFTSPDGLVDVNFVDTDGNAALDNFEASTEADFTSDYGISWSFAGTEGSEPAEVVFILTAVPPPGLAPGEQFTASYFVQVENVCGSVLNVDPVLTLSTQAPRALAILGNYPNPFGDATTIRFDLPEAGDVQVQVFDLMGREVATLVDAPLSAGTHEVTWNGALSNGQAIASGLYLVRLQAGGQTSTQRMTRVR